MSTMPRHVEKGGGHDGGQVRQAGPGELDSVSVSLAVVMICNGRLGRQPRELRRLAVS